VRSEGRTWAAAFVVVLVAAVAAAEALQAPTGVIAFRDVRLFDGLEVHDRTTVVVRDGRIVTVAPGAAVPEGATVVDGRGHTLLPGLIDAHVHAGGAVMTLEQAVIFGVTTSLDMFSNPEQVEARRAEQRATGAPGRSDVYSAGTLVTSPGGHGAQFGEQIPTITAPDEAPAFVADRIAEGSDYIKIVYDAYGADPDWTDTTDFTRGRWPSIDRATLAAVVNAAHARDQLAVVHVLNLRSARHALEAGADGLVHAFADEPADPAFIALAAERGLFVIPTLVVVGPALKPSELLNDPHITDFLHPSRLGPLLQQAFMEQDSTKVTRWHRVMRNVRALHERGIPILAGTDPPNPGAIYGASLHEEMVRLVEAGLSPVEALTAATSAPARAFNLTDRGRVARGLRADLVLVRGDPTTDIRASRDIAGVWKLGVPVDRDAYAAESAPQRRAWRALSQPGVSPISDFDHDSDQPTAVVGGWGRITDALWGGSSTASQRIVDGGADGTGKSLEVAGTTVANGDRTLAGPIYRPWGPVDLSAKRELVFRARGNAEEFRVIAFGANPSVGIAAYPFSVGAEWTEIVVPLPALAPVYPQAILGFVFTGPSAGGAFTLRIDDVRLR